MIIERVAVKAGSIEALVRFDAAEPMRTSEVPGLRDAVLGSLPGLRGHRCDNSLGKTFADELEGTEIAHLVEHAALEIMALAGSPDTLRGRTSWDFAADGPGVFHVRLDHDHDLVAIGSLRCASELVASLVSGRPVADPALEAARLRKLRTR